jgi:hypothetical protein
VIILTVILLASTTDGSELKASPRANCDASYPDVCIPSSPPDLDCDDILDKSFKVVPPDPHGFDSEGDGLGCESDNRNDDSNSNSSPSLSSLNQTGECKGSADCFRGTVTVIIDGDTSVLE